MKRTAIIATLAATLAVPAFAQTQLERQVGAEGLTLSQQAQLKFAQSKSGNDANVFFDGETFRFSTSAAHNERAQSILARIAAESAEDE